MLKKLLGNNIQKIDKLNDWKEAINLSCIPLIQNGNIREDYSKDIIKNVEKNGPYIVLDEGFALPHAQKGDNIIKTGMSYLYVRDGVDLMGNVVYSFLTLAAADNIEHISALQELSVLFDDESNMKEIVNGNIENIL